MSSSREETREGIAKFLCETVRDYNWADILPSQRIVFLFQAGQIMKYLHSQGVVIKVDRELPKGFLDGLERLLDPRSRYYYKEWHGVGITQVKNFIKEQAGYIATEPLIKEGK